jgi:hypothetical protein
MTISIILRWSATGSENANIFFSHVILSCEKMNSPAILLIVHILDALAIIAKSGAQNLDDRSTVHFDLLNGLCLFSP